MLVQLSKLSKSFLNNMKLKILKLNFAQAEESRRVDTCKLLRITVVFGVRYCYAVARLLL